MKCNKRLSDDEVLLEKQIKEPVETKKAGIRKNSRILTS